MIKPDITPEAIDRLIESIKVSAVDNYLDAIAALRAQAARIKQLEIWRGKYEHLRGLHLARDGSNPPTDGEIASAIKATEYKYFGDYEMSDEQRDAVEVLVTASQHMATARNDALREAAKAIEFKYNDADTDKNGDPKLSWAHEEILALIKEPTA
tara:strand:- start:166 stop:630 length:465 start_codon:yes stop_codon:yes gene_type:complete